MAEKNENKIQDLKEKEKQKSKILSIRLNTKTIFVNKTEEKTKSIHNNRSNFQNFNNTKSTNKNKKQIFKRINLKIASQLISNDLLKLKPDKKVNANKTIKVIKSNNKIKDNTFIPNKIVTEHINNKTIETIKEPNINIIKNNNNINNKRQLKNSNPFILINQPVEPMIIEMEKFKKMKMREKQNYLEKKTFLKKQNNSNKKIIKNKTNINFNKLKENFFTDDEKSNTIEKKQNERIKTKNMIFTSYKENINKNKKCSNRNKVDKININCSNSYLNHPNNLDKKRHFGLNGPNEIQNTNNEFNSTSLVYNYMYSTSISIEKEKEIIRNTFTTKKMPSLHEMNNNPLKKKVDKIEIGRQRKQLKINNHSSFTKQNIKINERNDIKQNINLIGYYRNNPQEKQNLKLDSKKIHSYYEAKKTKMPAKMEFLNKTQNSYNINDDNTLRKKEKDNDIIKNEIKKMIDVLYNNKKSNFEYFLNRLKKIIIIKNVQKSKEKEKEEIIQLKLSQQNKKKENIKEALNIVNCFYEKKMSLLKKSILKQLISVSNNNKKIKSAGIFITFFYNFNKVTKLKAFIQVKQIYQTTIKFDATKRIYNSLFQNISNSKYNTFHKFFQYFKISKQKECFIIIYKILSTKIKELKISIFSEMILYYNNYMRVLIENKIRSLVIKLQRNNIKKIKDIFESVIKYKKKLESIENIGKLSSNKILYNKRISFNKIKEFFSRNRKIEGMNRLNDIFIEIKLNKIRIYFIDFINNIKKIKISIAVEKVDKIFLLKKSKIKSDIFNKFKKGYKVKINIQKLFLILQSFIIKISDYNKRLSFDNIKNTIKEKPKIKDEIKKISKGIAKSQEFINNNELNKENKNSFLLEKKNTSKRWENNKIDNNIYNIQINSRKDSLKIPKNSLKEERLSFTFSKKEKENIMDNRYNNDEKSDDEIWTINVDKWEVMCNLDDSLYQKIIDD